MAIQAQMYSENLGFPLGCGGGGDGGGGGSQDLNDYGCGLIDFSFNLQEQQQPQQQQQQQQQMHHQQQQQNVQQYLQYVQLQQRNQKLFQQNNNNQSMVCFSQSMVAEMEKQKQEIDSFISLQNERLRLGLMQQRNQQLQSILKKCESKAQILLRQKDEEIAKAINRTMELEDFLRRIETESQTWQKLAIENDSMVVSLNNTIVQMKQQQQQQQQSCFYSNNINNGIEDAESCCETGERFFYEDEAENNHVQLTTGGKLVCRNCNSGNSSVILLPCRHLCACKECEVVLDSCPVCRMAKKSSIEVLF